MHLTDRLAAFSVGLVFTGQYCFNHVPSLILSPSIDLISKVSLSNAGRALQTDLNRIAETADTSTYEGLNSILTGEYLPQLSIT